MEANDRPIIHLSDEDLSAGLRRLARREQEITAALLAHLAEFDRRKLYLDAGCTSLWAYCLDVLRMGEGEAGKRIAAARAGRDYPMIFDLVATGQIHLSAVGVLAPKLTRENHVDLLQESVHKTKRRVEELVAARFPQPDAPCLIRKLPSPPAAPPEPLPLLAARPEPSATAPAPPPAAAPVAAPAPRRAIVTPTAADRYKVQFTATTALRDKLRDAQALLRHAIPDGDLAAVVERAVDTLLGELRRRKFAETRRPRRRAPTQPPKEGSRHVPNPVKREVAERDDHRCAFVAPDGRDAERRASSSSTTTTRGAEEDRRRKATSNSYVALIMTSSPGVTTASAISNSDAPTRSSPAADGRRMSPNEASLSWDCRSRARPFASCPPVLAGSGAADRSAERRRRPRLAPPPSGLRGCGRSGNRQLGESSSRSGPRRDSPEATGMERE